MGYRHAMPGAGALDCFSRYQRLRDWLETMAGVEKPNIGQASCGDRLKAEFCRADYVTGQALIPKRLAAWRR